MRNMCRIAPRLSSAMKNLLMQISANRGLCRYHSQYAESSRHKRGAQLRGYSEKVSNAIEAIRNNRARNVKSLKTLYLMDEEVAKEFSALIMANHPAKSSYVVEINSGLGFLSTELLKAGIPSINMFESVPYLFTNLISIVDKYPGRATLRSVDFQQLWSTGYVDWKDNSNKMKIYVDVEKRAWEEEPVIQIIGALENVNFFQRLMATIVFQNTLAKFGRMVLHVAIPPSVWAHLTCTNEHYDLYRWHSILFQTLFNFKLLGTFPRSAFYPHYRRQKPKKRETLCRVKIMRNDRRFMNVVRIEPKANLFKDNFTLSDIVPFYYFLHHHLKCRKNRVIPALEKWVPGCGRTLIAHGFNTYTEFGELTPQEIFNLFKLFRSWPEFKRSSFVSCMDTFLMRVNEHVVLEANEENLEEMFEFSLDQAQSPLE